MPRPTTSAEVRAFLAKRTSTEARKIINESGADLAIPGPDFTEE